MGHEKRTKVIAILALVVAVLGLSVGFSAYSKTLNIQNVQATVTGNQANFDVVFSTSSTSASVGTVTGSRQSGVPSGSGGTATLNGTTISNLTATFSEQGGAVVYQFYVYNKGSIPAYLTGINFGGKTCTGGTGTNSELVSAACSRIYVGVSINSVYYSSTNEKITNSKKLDPHTSEQIYVVINNNSSGTPVDGDFTATIPSITLTYSSQQNPTS